MEGCYVKVSFFLLLLNYVHNINLQLRIAAKISVGQLSDYFFIMWNMLLLKIHIMLSVISRNHLSSIISLREHAFGASRNSES